MLGVVRRTSSWKPLLPGTAYLTKFVTSTWRVDVHYSKSSEVNGGQILALKSVLKNYVALEKLILNS